MASFNLRLIGIILRDVLLREYPHFAITINFKMQPNCNFFTLSFMWVVAPAKFVLFLHVRNFSFAI